MALNIPALIAVVVFYVIILAIGLYAARKTAKTNSTQEMMLANRDLGLFVMTLSLSATWVGGAYINGTAQAMAFKGLIWTQAPIAYCVSLLVGGLLYTPKLRASGYVTMFDPMQKKFGNKMGGLLFIPEFLGNLFWTAAILAALGATLTIIVDLSFPVSVILSSCVAAVYTLLGGLLSVAYTDVVQFVCIIVGLILPIPFAATDKAVNFTRIADTWVGSMPSDHIGPYIDEYILMLFGNFTWQAYFQRSLACRTTRDAVLGSVFGGLLALLAGVPPAFIGVIGAATDWNATSYEGAVPIPYDQQGFILPMVLQHLCPVAVSAFGIGAVAAAAMSSTDSCFLATSSVVARNIYNNIFRPQASAREIIWVLRIFVVVVAILGSVIAMTVKTIYGLLVLCVDVIFVVQFPQLTCVLWLEVVNTYGSLCGFVIGFALRILGGEPLIGIPALLKYPFYDEAVGQIFPFKTFAMLCNTIITISVSYLTHAIFKKGWLPLKYDIFHVFQKKLDDEVLHKKGHGTGDSKVDGVNYVERELSASDGMQFATHRLLGTERPGNIKETPDM